MSSKSIDLEIKAALSKAKEEAMKAKYTSTKSCIRKELKDAKRKQGGTASTRSKTRRLLQNEEPEMLRPHCEKCESGQALRPGLDGRCYCPECEEQHDRCTSPRMAMRRQESDSCATFSRKLVATQVKMQAGERSQSKTSCKRATSSCSKKTSRENTTAVLPTFESTVKPFLTINSTAQQSGTSTASTTSSQKSSVNAIFKELEALQHATEGRNGSGSRAASRNLEKKDSTKCATGGCSGSGSRAASRNLEKKDSTKCATGGCSGSGNRAASRNLEKVTKMQKNQPSNAACCARRGYECLSANSQRFQRGECLRYLDIICYCEACIEFRDAECSSPRMAELRKSQAQLSRKN